MAKLTHEEIIKALKIVIKKQGEIVEDLKATVTATEQLLETGEHAADETLTREELEKDLETMRHTTRLLNKTLLSLVTESSEVRSDTIYTKLSLEK